MHGEWDQTLQPVLRSVRNSQCNLEIIANGEFETASIVLVPIVDCPGVTRKPGCQGQLTGVI